MSYDTLTPEGKKFIDDLLDGLTTSDRPGYDDMLKAARGIDKFFLVIESAVRKADPQNLHEVVEVLHANLNAKLKAEGSMK